MAGIMITATPRPAVPLKMPAANPIISMMMSVKKFMKLLC